MIRHVSVFKLKDVSEVQRMKRMLEDVGRECPLILHSEVGVNLAPDPTDPNAPLFGDLIQIIDFDSQEDCDAYPQSDEHRFLMKEGPRPAFVMACDYEI